MTRLAYPWVMLALAVVPIIVYVRYRLGERTPSLRYSDVAGLARLPRSLAARLSWLPFALRVAALALLLVALARPQRGATGEEIRAEGVDIMLVIDVSSSMLAEDFRPNNRLHVAKEVVADFIEKRDNDRLGMTVFARHAITKTPLTLDHDILLTHLEDVAIGTIQDGTAIGNAIASSVNRLKDSDAESRIMILLTDGENTAGEVDPVYRDVEIPIDEETLEEIATITGAQFFRARDAESLKAVYDEIDALETTEIEQIQYVRYTELAPYLMLVGLGFLATETVLSRTRLARFP
jgi:Ca-activated chloride channel family protein